jgi:cytochrome c biogenesis factor
MTLYACTPVKTRVQAPHVTFIATTISATLHQEVNYEKILNPRKNPHSKFAKKSGSLDDIQIEERPRVVERPN